MLHVQIVSNEGDVLESTTKEYLDFLLQKDGLLKVGEWLYYRLERAEESGYK